MLSSPLWHVFSTENPEEKRIPRDENVKKGRERVGWSKEEEEEEVQAWSQFTTARPRGRVGFQFDPESGDDGAGVGRRRRRRERRRDGGEGEERVTEGERKSTRGLGSPAHRY